MLRAPRIHHLWEPKATNRRNCAVPMRVIGSHIPWLVPLSLSLSSKARVKCRRHVYCLSAEDCELQSRDALVGLFKRYEPGCRSGPMGTCCRYGEVPRHSVVFDSSELCAAEMFDRMQVRYNFDFSLPVYIPLGIAYWTLDPGQSV